MSIKSRADLIKAVNQKKKELTDKDVFLSEAFKRLANSILMGVGKIYGINTFRVNIYSSPNSSMTACIDEQCRVECNVSHQALKDLSMKDKLTTLIGWICHETSHRLWTDFATRSGIIEKMMAGPLFCSESSLVIDSLLRQKAKRRSVIEIFADISNILEDEYIEQRFMSSYWGYAPYIKFSRDVTRESLDTQIESIKTARTNGVGTANIAQYLIYQYRFNHAIPDYDDEAVECLRYLEPFIKEAIADDNGYTRTYKFLRITDELLAWLKQKCDENQSNQSQQSDSSDSSDESDSNDNSDSNSSSSDSSNSSESSDSSNSNESNSDDDNSNDSNDSSSSNSDNNSDDSSDSKDSDSSDSSADSNESDENEDDDNESSSKSNSSNKDEGDDSREDNDANDSSSGKDSENSDDEDSDGNEGSTDSNSSDNEENADGDNSNSSKQDSTEGESDDANNTSNSSNENIEDPTNESSNEQQNNENSSQSNGATDFDKEIDDLFNDAKERNEKEKQSHGEPDKRQQPLTKEKPDPKPGEQNSELTEGEQRSLEQALDALLSDTAKDKVEQDNEQDELNEMKTALQNANMGEYHNYPSRISKETDITPSANFDEMYSEVKTIIRRLVKEFKRQIKDDELGGILDGLYCGKELTAPYRADKKCMGKKQMPNEPIDMSVMLLIDHSGSMNGKRIKQATKTAMVVYEFCKELGIDISIYGHNDLGYTNLLSYVEFGSISHSDLQKISHMRHNVGGCNRDGAAIRYCIDRLNKQSSEKKLFFMISDGMPNSDNYGANFYYTDETETEVIAKGNAKDDIDEILRTYRKKKISFITAGIDNKQLLEALYVGGLAKNVRAKYLDVSDLSTMPKKFISILKSEIAK